MKFVDVPDSKRILKDPDNRIIIFSDGQINQDGIIIKQIELSIREIGYGDVSINKKMKEYVNLFYSIIEKIEIWENSKRRTENMETTKEDVVK